MTDHDRCAFEDCEEPAVCELRFELTEPRDPSAIVGAFRLQVCEMHARPEFAADES
jgi:hypothetical protein